MHLTEIDQFRPHLSDFDQFLTDFYCIWLHSTNFDRFTGFDRIPKILTNFQPILNSFDWFQQIFDPFWLILPHCWPVSTSFDCFQMVLTNFNPLRLFLTDFWLHLILFNNIWYNSIWLDCIWCNAAAWRCVEVCTRQLRLPGRYKAQQTFCSGDFLPVHVTLLAFWGTLRHLRLLTLTR